MSALAQGGQGARAHTHTRPPARPPAHSHINEHSRVAGRRFVHCYTFVLLYESLYNNFYFFTGKRE